MSVVTSWFEAREEQLWPDLAAAFRSAVDRKMRTPRSLRVPVIGARVGTSPGPAGERRYGTVIPTPYGTTPPAFGFVWVRWDRDDDDRYDYTAHVEYVRDLYITDGNINPERTNP